MIEQWKAEIEKIGDELNLSEMERQALFDAKAMIEVAKKAEAMNENKTAKILREAAVNAIVDGISMLLFEILVDADWAFERDNPEIIKEACERFENKWENFLTDPTIKANAGKNFSKFG